MLFRSDPGMGDLLRFDAERLRILVERHLLHTGSARARQILDNWDASIARFVKVMPMGSSTAGVAPDALNGTNLMELFVFENEANGQALLTARLDNLGKGASGACVQNMDLMLGLKQTDAALPIAAE